MRAFLAILILLMPLHARPAEPLGRLFFTLEQRAQLDSLRTKKVVAAQVKDEPAPEFITYNGIIRRDDGKTTVWVNNKSLSEKDIRESASLVGRIERDGRIMVQPAQGSTAPALRLKVGQSAELLSGRIAEPFTATSPERNAAPAAKPASSTARKPDADDAEDSKAIEKPLASPSAAALLREASKISPNDPEAAAKLKALADAAR
jgi:hypothetical protein